MRLWEWRPGAMLTAIRGGFWLVGIAHATVDVWFSSFPNTGHEDGVHWVKKTGG